MIALKIKQMVNEPNDCIKLPYKISVLDGQEKNYFNDKDLTIPQSVYKDVSRIKAIGDFHGQYSRMIPMLKNAGVIDNNLQWQ